MKIKDIQDTIHFYKKKKIDISDYDIYLEQLSSSDKSYKKRKSRSDIPWHDKKNGQSWEWFKINEEGIGITEYFKTEGFIGIDHNKKHICININF
jgi:hypothetical protein